MESPGLGDTPRQEDAFQGYHRVLNDWMSVATMLQISDRNSYLDSYERISSEGSMHHPLHNMDMRT